MMADLAKRLVARFSALEPWYDWGATYIERMESSGEGPGRFISIQWLGLSLTLFFGRTPPERGEA